MNLIKFYIRNLQQNIFWYLLRRTGSFTHTIKSITYPHSPLVWRTGVGDFSAIVFTALSADNFTGVINLADGALYKAKNEGRNRIVMACDDYTSAASRPGIE
jgi:hypothetical protein